MMQTRKARWAVGLGVVLGLALLAATAWAEPASVVVYSYSQLKVGNSAQYVLIPTAGQFKVEPGTPLSVAVVNGVFNELKTRKSTTYGGSTLDISAASLEKGTATVKIDPAQEKYAPIIISETVYTLTQLGLTSISFPGHSKKPMARKDVPYAAFEMIVPAWRALPPNQVAPATLMLPDGAEMAADAFYQKLKAGDPALVAMLQTYLGGDDLDVVAKVARAIPSLGLAQGPQLLLPLLKHADPKIRLAALESLQGSEDAAALDAISAVMDKDKDPQVALKASQILGQSKNKAYSVRALFFALRGPDEAASIEAVKSLAQSKEPSAIPELVTAARGNRQPVALAAIDALVALEQPAELEKLFSDGKLDKERQLRASSGALKLKDEKVKFGALTHQASQAPAPDALKALEGLAGVKDPDPRPSIEGALLHPEAPVRHDAAKRLAKIKNPASLKALSDAGTKPEDAEVIQTAASEIMGGLPVADILTYTGNKNIILQRVAYLALGLKADTNNPKIFETLKKGTASSDAGIRASSVLALPAFKDDKAKEAILALGKDADPQVRRNVARALASWPAGTGTELLLGYLSDASGDVTQAAIETLESQGEGTAYTPILKLFRGKPAHAGTRGACLKALVKLAPEKELQTVISTVGGGLFDEDRGVKILAIDLLGRYDNPASVTTLAALINDPVEEYRVRSILAMGNTGSNDAVELLVSVLNDQSKPVRLATMQSLGKLGKKSAAPAIEKRIAVEDDAEVVEAGKAALKGLK